jgi:HlyD family secretion protein
VAVCACTLVLLGFRALLKPTFSRASLVTAVAERGSIEATVSASGVVVPEYEMTITSPIQARIERVFHYAGEKVKAGEPILQLDKEFTLLEYERLNDELGVKKNKITQLKLGLRKNLIELEAQQKIKKLAVKSLQTQLEQEMHLVKIGGGTQEQVEQARLNLETASLELSQIGQQMKNQEATITADLKAQDFEIGIQEKTINELKRKIEKAEVRVEKDGVITWVNGNIGSSLNANDELVRVADLRSFKVDGSIADTYADALKPGGGVVVRINDKVDVRGTIANVEPAIENRIIKFTVNLDRKDHALLRANQQVDVFVLTDLKNNVVRVKNGPAFEEGEEQKVFVLRDNKATQRLITIGASNFDYVELLRGVNPGEEVIISGPEGFKDVEAFVVE